MNQSAAKAARADMKATGMVPNHRGRQGRYKIPKAAKRFFSGLSRNEKAKLIRKWKHVSQIPWSQTLAQNIRNAIREYGSPTVQGE